MSISCTADVAIVQKVVDALWSSGEYLQAPEALHTIHQDGTFNLSLLQKNASLMMNTQATMLFNMVSKLADNCDIDEDGLLEFFRACEGDRDLSDDAKAHIQAMEKLMSSSSAAGEAEESAIRHSLNLFNTPTSIAASCFKNTWYGAKAIAKSAEILRLASIDRGFQHDLENCESECRRLHQSFNIFASSGCKLSSLHEHARRLRPCVAKHRSIIAGASKGFKQHNKDRLDSINGVVSRMVQSLSTTKEGQFWEYLAKPLKLCASQSSVMSMLAAQPLVAAAGAFLSNAGLCDLIDQSRAQELDSLSACMNSFHASLVSFVELHEPGSCEFDLESESAIKLFHAAVALV